MTAHDVSSLIEWLRRHELLGPEQLAEAAGALQERLLEAPLLLEELVFRGWLTPFQAGQFRNGGRVRLGRYVLLECLGRGGQGEVFKALDRTMNRVVALKVLRGAYASDAEAFRRFQREVRVLAELSHPNLVAAHHAELTGEVPFLVMEYAAGVSLGRLVAERGPLPLTAACELVRQAAVGLQHVHERGFVHRDVKPSNLLLVGGGDAAGAGRGVVKVLDLGLARSDAPAADSLTNTGAVMGTPDYMAPEQALDPRTADARADVYSLGCTLYHLLTGRPPYPRGSAFEKLLQHRESEPTPVESLRADVPLPLAAVVRRMMARRREDRYPTAADAARAVEPFCEPDAGGETWLDGRPWEGAEAAETAAPGQPASTTQQASRPNFRRRRRVALAAGLLPVLGLLAWWWWPASPPPTLPAPRPTATVAAAGDGDFRSIKDAIDGVRPGTLIRIRPGTYRESVVLGKEVELVGDGPAGEVRVEATAAPALTIKAAKARIRNLSLSTRGATVKDKFAAVAVEQGEVELEDCRITSESVWGLAITGAGTNPTLRRCRIHDCAGAGVYVDLKARGTLTDCDVERNRLVGVAVMTEADPVLRDCRIVKTREGFGVAVARQGRGTVQDCTIADSKYGSMEIRTGGNPLVKGCWLYAGETAAVFVAERGKGRFEKCSIFPIEFPGVVVREGGEPSLSGCKIVGGKKGGVLVQADGRAALEDCTVFNNELVGVRVEAGGAVRLGECTISKNRGPGISVRAGGAAVLAACVLSGNGGGEHDFEAGADVTIDGKKRPR